MPIADKKSGVANRRAGPPVLAYNAFLRRLTGMSLPTDGSPVLVREWSPIPEAQQPLWRRVAIAAQEEGVDPDLYVWRLMNRSGGLATTLFFHRPAELPNLGEEYRRAVRSVSWPCISHSYQRQWCARLMAGRGAKTISWRSRLSLEILRDGSQWGGEDSLSREALNVVWRWAMLRNRVDKGNLRGHLKAKAERYATELLPAAMWRFLIDRDLYRKVDWWGPELESLDAKSSAAWKATTLPGISTFG